MPCMCGDTHCWSCGPAQGNWRCPICRAWADDGCEHIAEDSGVLRPEFEAAAADAERKERESDDAQAQEDAWLQAHADQIKAYLNGDD